SVLGDDHLWRYVAISDRSALGLGDRLVGVGRHLERVLVLESSSGAGAEVFADDAPKSESLLEPIAPVYGELADRRPRPYGNPARRVAVRYGQFAQERGHLGVGKGWEAR